MAETCRGALPAVGKSMEIQTKDEMVTLVQGNSEFVFERETGRLLQARSGGVRYALAGLMVDVGVEGKYVRRQLRFDSLDNKSTWELPAVAPLPAQDAAVFQGFETVDGRLEGIYWTEGLEIRQQYDLVAGVLRVGVRVRNVSRARVTIHGTAFLLTREGLEDRFEFPTNVPSEQFSAASLPSGTVIAGGLVGAMTHVEGADGHLNLLFLDTVEKWSQAAYRTGPNMRYAYVAAVECWLEPGQDYTCGYFYVQPVPEGDPYEAIAAFFEGLGYRPAQNGIREGVLYACHPHGTMDGNFAQPRDLYAYAEELDEIAAMGVKHIWVLPIFEHLDRGVYHPTDQKIIDARYGGDEAVRAFVEKAHALGMTVLFDYVPHGPAPGDPLAVAKPEWCSLRRDLTPQEEWDCVSFDMTNPEYLRYTSDMVNGHVRRFDIDGARIDCAMGGLSNWNPWPGHRPSASNLMGGVAISGAIQQGFLEMGKRALNMPENFNPVPSYYPVTDVFYGMNLYRVLVALDAKRADAPVFVRELTRFLEIEHKAMPKELKKLRFLGNHDTVSWVWQSKRAYEAYGVERAKALFALMALIDGVPMIYQGDEDPAFADKEGPVLRDFFRDLYVARAALIGEGVEIDYLYTGNGVMAFVRTVEGQRRLVLISMSEQVETVALVELREGKPLLGTLVPANGQVAVPPYAFDLFDIL